ncbi:MAG: alpha/beta hydrolase, partial [Gammaproteobacteria bacterium]|nr:alpha/beta hydrolase [Gammaproteobacteria bacterium]
HNRHHKRNGGINMGFGQDNNIVKDIVWEVPEAPDRCDSVVGLNKGFIHSNGCEIYYETQGEGVPIVLLNPGPGGSHQAFHPYFSKASTSSQVIYYDPRGVGKSEWKPEQGYTVQQAINDLENLRESLGIKQWGVLGWSFGGLLAQQYALQHPDKLLSLVLVTASPGLPNLYASRERNLNRMTKEEQGKLKKIWEAIHRKARQENWEKEKTMRVWIYNKFKHAGWKLQFQNEPNEKDLASFAGPVSRVDAEYPEQMSRSANEINLEGKFENFEVSTLIMESTHDITFTEDKPGALKENHPHAEMILFEHSLHTPFLEEEDKFFEKLNSFVKKLRLSSRSLKQPV